jgi:hypothetical protein
MEHDFILQRVVQERAIVVSVTITLIEYIGIQWLTPAQYYNKLLFVHASILTLLNVSRYKSHLLQ